MPIVFQCDGQRNFEWSKGRGCQRMSSYKCACVKYARAPVHPYIYILGCTGAHAHKYFSGFMHRFTNLMCIDLILGEFTRFIV